MRAAPETGTGEHPPSAIEELPPPTTPIVVEDLSAEAEATNSDDPDDAGEPDASADNTEVAATAEKPADKTS